MQWIIAYCSIEYYWTQWILLPRLDLLLEHSVQVYIEGRLSAFNVHLDRVLPIMHLLCGNDREREIQW